MIVSKNGTPTLFLEITVSDASLISALVNQGLERLNEADPSLSKVATIPALRFVHQIYEKSELVKKAMEAQSSPTVCAPVNCDEQ